MPYNETYLLAATSRTPWNKGKLIGAKPRLRPKHVRCDQIAAQQRNDAMCQSRPSSLFRIEP